MHAIEMDLVTQKDNFAKALGDLTELTGKEKEEQRKTGRREVKSSKAMGLPPAFESGLSLNFVLSQLEPGIELCTDNFPLFSV